MNGPCKVCCVALFLLWSGLALAQEKEPNDREEQASRIEVGKALTGVVHFSDGRDFYKLTLPGSGIVTLTLSGFPADCTFQVGVMGFQKYATSVAGWVDGEAGKPITCSFTAQGGHQGYIWVNLIKTVSNVAGDGWGAVRCTKDGPWHQKPFHDKPTKNAPGAYEGARVLGPIKYQLKLTFQPVKDDYEPNYEPGIRHPDMLKKGMLKTLTIGKSISAYLFNERPGFLRGTKGKEDSRGGEDDTDIYHVKLDEPDKVKVSLRDLPDNANIKIILYHPQGWAESKKGERFVEADVKKAGDLFIEVSRGRENRPLVCSAKPYKLLVTTGKIPAEIGAGPAAAGPGEEAPVAGGAEGDDLDKLLDEDGIDYFPDELAAMKKFEADPSDANRRALIKIRMGYAVALATEAERTRDAEMHARALQCAEAAVALDGKDAAALAILGRVYSALRDSRTAQMMAEDAFRQSLKLGDNVGTRLLLAQTLMCQDRYRAALDEFEKALAADPKCAQPQVMIMMCTAYALDRRPDAGAAFFSKVLKGNPNADSARLALAFLLKQQGKTNEGIAELQKVMGRDGASDEYRKYAWQLAKAWREEAKE